MPPTSVSDAEIYARSLLSRCHGYALWIPEPFGAVASQRSAGVRIGDVGYITEEGAFETLFNVTANPDDPINQHGVPEGFQPITIREQDIAVVGDFHAPGAITSKSGMERNMGFGLGTANNPMVPAGANTNVAYSWTSSEGAILHLPNGASRIRAPPELFKNYAIRNARSWYDFVNNQLHRGVPSGSLYLITTCDKSDSWMVGAFSDAASGRRVALSVNAMGMGQGSANYSYSWENHNSPAYRVGPRRGSPVPSSRLITPGEGSPSPSLASSSSTSLVDRCAPDGRNQCIFVKGYNIAIRKSRLTGNLKPAKLALIENLKPSDVMRLSMYDLRSGLFGSRSSGEDLSTSGSRGTSQGGSSRTGSNVSEKRPEREQEDHHDEDTFIEVEYFPRMAEHYHPSIIMNELLFQIAPDSEVALTHDDDWISLIEAGPNYNLDTLQDHVGTEDGGSFFHSLLAGDHSDAKAGSHATPESFSVSASAHEQIKRPHEISELSSPTLRPVQSSSPIYRTSSPPSPTSMATRVPLPASPTSLGASTDDLDQQIIASSALLAPVPLDGPLTPPTSPLLDITIEPPSRPPSPTYGYTPLSYPDTMGREPLYTRFQIHDKHQKQRDNHSGSSSNNTSSPSSPLASVRRVAFQSPVVTLANSPTFSNNSTSPASSLSHVPWHKTSPSTSAPSVISVAPELHHRPISRSSTTPAKISSPSSSTSPTMVPSPRPSASTGFTDRTAASPIPGYPPGFIPHMYGYPGSMPLPHHPAPPVSLTPQYPPTPPLPNPPLEPGYALICSKCFTHNGLLGETSFYNTAYNCPRCHHFNPQPTTRGLPQGPSRSSIPPSTTPFPSAVPQTPYMNYPIYTDPGPKRQPSWSDYHYPTPFPTSHNPGSKKQSPWAGSESSSMNAPGSVHSGPSMSSTTQASTPFLSGWGGTPMQSTRLYPSSPWTGPMTPYAPAGLYLPPQIPSWSAHSSYVAPPPSYPYSGPPPMYGHMAQMPQPGASWGVPSAANGGYYASTSIPEDDPAHSTSTRSQKRRDMQSDYGGYTPFVPPFVPI